MDRCKKSRLCCKMVGKWVELHTGSDVALRREYLTRWRYGPEKASEGDFELGFEEWIEVSYLEVV